MKPKGKIGFLVSEICYISGTSKVTANVANALVGEYDIYIISLHDQPEAENPFPLDPRIKLICLGLPYDRLRKVMVKSSSKVNRLINSLGIQVCVLVGNYQGFTTQPVIWAQKLRKQGCKFLFHDHGALLNQWDAKPIRFIRALCSYSCAKVITLTDKSRRDYIRKFRLRDSQVVSIPNWIDPEMMSGSVDMSAKKIMWVGRLAAEKGVLRIAEIAKKVLPQFPGWQWEVYGEGSLRTDLEKKLAEYGLEDQVILKGNKANIADYYQGCSIFTLTSDREGLPLVLLEAKSKGMPMISFDISTGPNEVIREGKDGFLIKPFCVDQYAEKLRLLMADVELRKRMAQANLEDVHRFSKEEVVKFWKLVCDENLNYNYKSWVSKNG